ncbi:MAG: V-type ATP synthase subunit E [Methanoregulaceae archaeon]|jgi:V/A-type H+-transporting ATPase subunit E|nr:V-type ATP synthase subunit E [Methanoregulaceae archaeon]
MKYDHLIKAIEDGAEEKIREITDSKDREIREILERAESESAQLRKDLLAQINQRVEIERNKEIYSAREQAKDQLARARNGAFLSVFQVSDEQLSSLRSSPSYGAFFKAVMTEITGSLDSEKIRLHIDPKDEALCRQLIKDTGGEFEIVTDLTTKGGLTGSTPDGKVVIRNTIEDRLARAKERMKVVVFSGLYGDQDVR